MWSYWIIGEYDMNDNLLEEAESKIKSLEEQCKISQRVITNYHMEGHNKDILDTLTLDLESARRERDENAKQLSFIRNRNNELELHLKDALVSQENLRLSAVKHQKECDEWREKVTDAEREWNIYLNKYNMYCNDYQSWERQMAKLRGELEVAERDAAYWKSKAEAEKELRLTLEMPFAE